MNYDRERPAIETDPEVYDGLSKDAIESLLAAGKLSQEMRDLTDRLQEAAKERRALMVRATKHDRQATYPIVKRMVGLGLSVVTREIRLGREEEAKAARAVKRKSRVAAR